MGDFAKARDSYEKALAVDPNFIPALNNLAYIYSEKLSNLDRAAELARKAHELYPSEPSVMQRSNVEAIGRLGSVEVATLGAVGVEPAQLARAGATLPYARWL